jgi:hypothetical protein
MARNAPAFLPKSIFKSLISSNDTGEVKRKKEKGKRKKRWR